MIRAVRIALLTLAVTMVPAVSDAAEPTWTLEQPAPPAGNPYPAPVGAVGDIGFFSANRGLMSIEGNAVWPRGLLAYDGQTWKQLSTVCGSTGAQSRIAWAGPREFWTISDTAVDQPSPNQGVTLCHFKDGVVADSFAVADEAADPYFRMNAAACAAPNDCWFGGRSETQPGGGRQGAFHLHWNGSGLTSVYNEQGRGVSDLESYGGRVVESVFIGPGENDTRAPTLGRPEDPPRILHSLSGESFLDDPFTPAARSGVGSDGAEFLALDGDEGQLWAVGGGAASGEAAEQAGGVVQRPPLAARKTNAGFGEVPIADSEFAARDRFVGVASIPDRSDALVAVAPAADTGDQGATVARIGADGSVTEKQQLPADGAPRGAASRIACAAANDCWMATATGWLFHYSDGQRPARDDDPAFAGVISARPRDGRSPQIRPNTPPDDDSQRFAPPPVQVEPPVTAAPAAEEEVKASVRQVRSKLIGRSRLQVAFRLNLRSRVALIAERRGKVVARTKSKVLRPGRHTLTLKINPKRYPTKLRFSIKAP